MVTDKFYISAKKKLRKKLNLAKICAKGDISWGKGRIVNFKKFKGKIERIEWNYIIYKVLYSIFKTKIYNEKTKE